MKTTAAQRRASAKWQKANRETFLAYQRRYRDTRRDITTRWKLAAGCFDCGYNANAAALDFDHVQGQKVIAVSRMTHGPHSKLLAEMEKCVVRCANCHRIKTHGG